MMDIRTYKLFIDESGTADIQDKNSKLYIVAGCSIEEQKRERIKIKADQIKFKYWGDTNVVFHSREIGRKENHFSILKDKKIYTDFLKDLENFLSEADFKMLFVVVDKEEAIKYVWDERYTWNRLKIYKETSNHIIKNFLLILLTGDSRGKIIVESATAEKDFYFHKAVGHLTADGIKELNVGFGKVQDTLTSISFVSKKNHDIEEQIADLFAYGAKCKYLAKQKKKFRRGEYESLMMDLCNKKLFKIPKNAGIRKMKYFKEVEPFLVLPTTEDLVNATAANAKTGSRHHARSPVSKPKIAK